MADTLTINISPEVMLERFTSVLLQSDFTKERAEACAKIFTDNSVDGIYTHGVNRFPVFVQYAGQIRKCLLVLFAIEPFPVSTPA